MNKSEEVRYQSKTVAKENDHREQELASLVSNIDISEATVICDVLVKKYPLVMMKKLEEEWIEMSSTLAAMQKVFGGQ